MRSAGSGVPKMSSAKLINGSTGRNKGNAKAAKAGTNKANGTSAGKVTKVK